MSPSGKCVTAFGVQCALFVKVSFECKYLDNLLGFAKSEVVGINGLLGI